MNASTPGGERVRDELVEAAARAAVEYDELVVWDDEPEGVRVLDREQARAVLRAVLPLLIAADVPHIERDLRARLAAVIGECDLADSRGSVSLFSKRVRRAAEGPGQ